MGADESLWNSAVTKRRNSNFCTLYTHALLSTLPFTWFHKDTTPYLVEGRVMFEGWNTAAWVDTLLDAAVYVLDDGGLGDLDLSFVFVFLQNE